MGWAFLTRAGSEPDLIDELGREGSPRRVAEGVVLALSRPRKSDGHHGELTFARQAMRVGGRAGIEAEPLAKLLADRLGERDDPEPFQLQIVVPDSKDPKDPRRKIHSRLGELLPLALDAVLSPAQRALRQSGTEAQRILQVWILSEAEVLYGLTPTKAALSPHPGGKLRLKRPDDALSRSGLKLDEAIAWIGLGPDRGDLVVDLGAAPGGWSQVALGRGAAVVAVDPAVVKLEGSKNRFTHIQESAFTFAPPEAMDWLLCDMAWRPLEVAQLLAKWARRGWARQLIANFKLPMKQKAKILREILGILRDAGWEGLRSRQLYHDRDEITIFGWLNGGIVARGWQPAFELRAHRNQTPEGEKPRRTARNARAQAGKQGRPPRSAEDRAEGRRGPRARTQGPRGRGGGRPGPRRPGGGRPGPRRPGGGRPGARRGGPR
ncbi:MAG: 23S rRNA (cytidine(2498)-2'-O)-methyltransferase RlmM [Deltaproteobacteria bacterium]|nr:23S rRNA (cytidine(2498)-2'-O)-methyltransferase RlmM [Deltaproteobacteria bacterium]